MNNRQMMNSSEERAETAQRSRRQIMAGFGAIALGALAAGPGASLAALEPAVGATNRDLTNNTQHTKHTRHTQHGSGRRRNRRRNRRR